ncbi:MAG: hypothetical protein RR444_11430 [Oscillospiraceae bacterium]
MKTIEVLGTIIVVNSHNKMISVKGNTNANQIQFRLARFEDSLDLSSLSCIIKTMNQAGKNDVIIPQVVIGDTTLDVIFRINHMTTLLDGNLELQIEFHKLTTDGLDDIVWQSNIAEFIIGNSLLADRIFEQVEPSVLQQWEKRVADIQSNVTTMHNEVKGSIATINRMSAELDHLFDTVLPSVTGDAKSVNGKVVDDAKTDLLSLWTSAKTKAEIQSAMVGVSFGADASYEEG